MRYVLLRDGPGRLSVARIVAEHRRTIHHKKNVRVLTCRQANDYGSRNPETKTLEVFPSMILAEWEDEQPTEDTSLNYNYALKELAGRWSRVSKD